MADSFKQEYPYTDRDSMHHFCFSLTKPAYLSILNFFVPLCDPDLPLSLKMSNQTRHNIVWVKTRVISCLQNPLIKFILIIVWPRITWNYLFDSLTFCLLTIWSLSFSSNHSTISSFHWLCSQVMKWPVPLDIVQHLVLQGQECGHCHLNTSGDFSMHPTDWINAGVSN